MTIEKFEKLVNEGIKAIPKEFLEKLENVDIVVEETPVPEQLRKLKIEKGSFLFGLYEGVPQTKRWGYGQVLPDKITIFKNPIEKIARGSEKEAKRTSSLLHLHPATRESVIKEIVRDTVWHEIAHHFGLDEKKLVPSLRPPTFGRHLVKQAESRRN